MFFIVKIVKNAKILKKFKGNLLFTSHDHELTQTVANRIIELGLEKKFDKDMEYVEYLEKKMKP